MADRVTIYDLIMREASEATVALSHEPDCACPVCGRVRKRNARWEAERGQRKS